VLPVALAEDVETSEGVLEESRRLRENLADLGGFQCGFCTPGQVMSALALLREGLPDDDAEARTAIRLALAGNICRCTGYTGLVEGVLRTARRAEVAP
jgi:aerobic-type carbon monoxide dehydrogenase small subunit (CoxS/CutS family)